MQLKIYTIPIMGGEEIVDEMNAFLRSHKVVTIDKQFCIIGDGAVWSFCITYVDGGTPQLPKGTDGERRGKTDYREVLDGSKFAVFSQLRTIRKQLAEEDAVPAYAVFTDAELAEIAQLENIDESHMAKIQGIGLKRMEKYGKIMCERYSLLASKS